jgi:glycosyltransferase involved in cell wall biosynthesis
MKVLHVTPSFYPATCYGGPIQSSHGLCNNLAKIDGVELRVLTTDANGPERLPGGRGPVQMPAGYEVRYARRTFGDEFSIGQFAHLHRMIKWADVIHLSSTYSPPTLPTLAICRLLSKPVVWCPRGALQRWQGSTRRSAKAAWEKICNSLCDPRRVVLHFTSIEERNESHSRIPNATPIVIPNGVDIPILDPPVSKVSEALSLVYLGRLHPIKGIENLLHAISQLGDWATLSICGDGEPTYRAQLERLSNELGLNGRVEFLGRVDGEFKEAQFRKADICIVPSFKENFCIVVAEALARGVPVIASKGTPWERLNAIGCGLWVDNDPQALATAINDARPMPLREMGERGREWMKDEFSWSSIAAQMVREYGALIAARPAERAEYLAQV